MTFSTLMETVSGPRASASARTRGLWSILFVITIVHAAPLEAPHPAQPSPAQPPPPDPMLRPMPIRMPFPWDSPPCIVPRVHTNRAHAPAVSSWFSIGLNDCALMHMSSLDHHIKACCHAPLCSGLPPTSEASLVHGSPPFGCALCHALAMTYAASHSSRLGAAQQSKFDEMEQTGATRRRAFRWCGVT